MISQRKLFHQRFQKITFTEIKNAQPFWYSFKLDSVHFHNSKDLFIKARELIISQLELINKELPKISTGEEIDLVIQRKNENVFVITINGYDDTIGNIIQTNLSQAITESSVLSTCGYKKITLLMIM